MPGSPDRIAALFGAARELDAEARSAFLSIACGSDVAVRQEVEQLLAEDRTANSMLDVPISRSMTAEVFDEVLAHLREGQVLGGRYRIEAALGAGGQGYVYRATDILLNRPVVVKLLRDHGRGAQSKRERMQREKEALSRLRHPGIVEILDVSTLDESHAFIVMQFVDGRTLRKVMDGGPIPRDRAARILRGIASALRAAHSAGIVHGDLKPANIMLQEAENDHVKLIDFGIAKIERLEGSLGQATLLIAGTARYMAPEQFEGHRSAACDLYALGLICCEMLCGQPDPRALPRSLPPAARKSISEATAYLPERRPVDVNQWAEDLANALTSHSRRNWLVVLGAGAVVGGMASLGWQRFTSAEGLDRVIEKVGAFDPLDEGFSIHNEVSGTVVSNPDRTGFDAWLVSSTRQGDYRKRLNDNQIRAALSRGWVLKTRLRAIEGGTSVVANFKGRGPRFDINVLAAEKETVVRLNTQIVPDWQGLEWKMAPDSNYHEYEMRYDPGLKAAALWVDGVKRLDGYQGHIQFQENACVSFGVALFRGPKAVGAFQSVRFEVLP